MKLRILAGWVRSRLAEKRAVKPKPIVDIGGRPVLWQSMKQCGHYGFKDLVIALGHKGE